MASTSKQGEPVRLGMITPSSNTVLEPVTYQLLSGDQTVTAHFSRLPVTRITIEDEQSAQFDVSVMVEAGRLLADAKVDAIVWNGTSGSWLGLDHDRAIVAALTKHTAIPATTSTLALFESFRAYGITRLGLVTPYTEQVNRLIVQSYRQHGMEVVTEDHLDLTDNAAFSRVSPCVVSEQIRRIAPTADAVAVVCTNVAAAIVAPELELELNIPIIDSVAVTLWGALKLVGSSVTFSQWGTVLRDGTVRTRLQDICEALLKATDADRTTIRLDWPEHGLSVNLPAAESLRPGVVSIRADSSLDQRGLDTVAWLEEHRTLLSQARFDRDPMPPQELVDKYGVRAQMLGPIEKGGGLVGWVSAHSACERAWSAADLAAMNAARDEVSSQLG